MSSENCEKYLDQLLSEEPLSPEASRHLEECPSCSNVRNNTLLLKKEESVYPLPGPIFIRQTAEKLASNWKTTSVKTPAASNFIYPVVLFVIGTAVSGWLYVKTISDGTPTPNSTMEQPASATIQLPVASTTSSVNTLTQTQTYESIKTGTASQGKTIASPFEENVGK
ncbi:MAG: hypothetical protein HQM10_12980 [Candidatus Riflebacteria bacterium]|nr:hypothetical protein [Candidatus Riflebacteria bacterium]